MIHANDKVAIWPLIDLNYFCAGLTEFYRRLLECQLLASSLPLRMSSFAAFRSASMLLVMLTGSFKLGLVEVLNSGWRLIKTVLSSSLAELDSFI
jgi:hypothetical protein